jgi:hypothetical protein
LERLKNLNDCNLIGDKKQVQEDKNRQFVSMAKGAEKCAVCGGENPEFVLEDTHLCFDCYKAEKYYWSKGSV